LYVAVAEQRDDFPNNFVGDLVPTERGWVVVPPTCCPDGHAYSDPGWSVSSVWCTCNDRHMAWRCMCGKSIYAPQPGPHCRIRDIGPVSIWEDEQRQTPDDRRSSLQAGTVREGGASNTVWMTTNAKPYAMRASTPTIPRVIAAIDLVRWELSLGT
jgi:hypothetical protein